MNGKILLVVMICLISLNVINAQLIDKDQINCYLKFDNNLDNSSSSNATFSQTIGTSISYGTGKFGQAGYFSDVALVSSGINFNPYDGFTMIAWLNMDQLSSVAGAQTWVHQKDVAGQNPGRIHMEVLAEDYLGSFTDGVRGDDVTPILANTWYHFAVVKDASAGKRYIYVNGVLVNEVNGGIESNTGEIVLGARKNETDLMVKGGLMDEFLLTSQVLDITAINSIMNDGVEAAMTSTLINKYPVSEKNYYNDGILHISFSQPVSQVKYSIYDISGKCFVDELINIESSTYEMPLQLKKGIYILKVTSPEGIISNKFIVK
nr:LamG-like jellyroll fold domain-containing protein [uncultured Carboxylicivirga sp.]